MSGCERRIVNRARRWSGPWCGTSCAWPDAPRRSACSPAARSGRWATRRTWTSPTVACYRRHTRLDMDYLVLLTDALAREPDVRSALRFGVNTSLYPARDTSGTWRSAATAKAGRTIRWPWQRPAIWQRLWRGPRKAILPRRWPQRLLEEDPEASPEEAQEYIDELIDSQVLVSELRPAVTGPEPLGGLVERLRECGVRSPQPSVLDQARRELEALDARGLGNDRRRYRHIAGLLEGLPGQPDLARLFQVDMVKPVRPCQPGTGRAGRDHARGRSPASPGATTARRSPGAFPGSVCQPL